jgi:hypothetical protein
VPPCNLSDLPPWRLETARPPPGLAGSRASPASGLGPEQPLCAVRCPSAATSTPSLRSPSLPSLLSSSKRCAPDVEPLEMLLTCTLLQSLVTACDATTSSSGPNSYMTTPA